MSNNQGFGQKPQMGFGGGFGSGNGFGSSAVPAPASAPGGFSFGQGNNNNNSNKVPAGGFSFPENMTHFKTGPGGWPQGGGGQVSYSGSLNEQGRGAVMTAATYSRLQQAPPPLPPPATPDLSYMKDQIRENMLFESKTLITILYYRLKGMPVESKGTGAPLTDREAQFIMENDLEKVLNFIGIDVFQQEHPQLMGSSYGIQYRDREKISDLLMKDLALSSSSTHSGCSSSCTPLTPGGPDQTPAPPGPETAEQKGVGIG